MSDNSRAMAATVVGAVIGGMAGYMFFTEQRTGIAAAARTGARRLLARAQQLPQHVQKAAGVANEGWKVLNEALGEGGERIPRYPNPHQTSPF